MRILASLTLIGLLIVLIELWQAPEGYEDETGFHLGRGARS
jgi:hypothetical protein